MEFSGGFLNSKTPIFGQKLYVVVIATILVVLAIFSIISVFLSRKWRSKRSRIGVKRGPILPLVFQAISEVKASDKVQATEEVDENSKAIVLVGDVPRIVEIDSESKAIVLVGDVPRIVEIDSESKKRSSESNESSLTQSESSSALSASTGGLGNSAWGRWYSLRELQIATNQFCDENVIGEGGFGIVYRGVLPDGSVVAVKNLLNNNEIFRCTLECVKKRNFYSWNEPFGNDLFVLIGIGKGGQAKNEFKVEVEAIGKVRHKNLVGLIGYCAEGAQSLLVYEYIDNGNLEQWLHGEVGPVSPLTWEIRMKIAIGTARGLAYLHEGLEPKVVHRDVKSSNILLDRKWNPKISDFGLAKLLGSEKSYVTTRVMGTFGYVSPEYASTGMLNEGNDVYSYGVLLMEIITGRIPIDYSRPPGEVNLIDWVKGMITSRRGEELVDPLIDVHPPSRVLKRMLLVCLRCVDLDTNKRPKMGQIVHMLEADEFPYHVAPRPTG